MKIQNRLVLVTATAITAMFVIQAKAQYRPVGDDGIAASPKVRQMLDERARAAATAKPQAAPYTSYRAVGADGIAASPKVRQMLNEQQAQAAAPRDVAVTYSPRYVDGIVASPKLREQHEQDSRSFQVAPIK